MTLADIKSVGVVGSGTMGFGIAINFALGGYRTVISDVDDETLKRSMANIQLALSLFVEEKLITQEQASRTLTRIEPTTDLEKLATQSDFVTEAIVERLADKQELFNKLDAWCPPHTILVSNTSGTSDETYEIIYDLMKKIKRIPIRVLKELPGYLLNRIQGAMGREATRLWAEGVATAEDIELGIQSTFELPSVGNRMNVLRLSTVALLYI